MRFDDFEGRSDGFGRGNIEREECDVWQVFKVGEGRDGARSSEDVDSFSHKSPHDTLPKATFTTACHECCIHVSEIFSYFPFYVSQI